jgi:RNA polymerase sigma-70 factor (ECF subfamily)
MRIRLPLLLLSTLAACDSQVDGNHNGTPLANLAGSVANQRTAPIDNAEVVILWMNSSSSPDVSAAETVPVEGNFPAEFQLSIYEPPIDALINDAGDSRMGVALIISAEAGGEIMNEGTGVLGMDQNHLLVYLPEDVVAGTTVATMLRGTPKAGFHIYDVGHLSEAEQQTRQECEDSLGDPSLQELFDTCGGFPQFDDFLPAPADLTTPLEVDLVDDLDQLDVPNWTSRHSWASTSKPCTELRTCVAPRPADLANDDDAGGPARIFANLVARPSQFDGRSAPSTFLYAVTTHACLARLRDRKNRTRLLDEQVRPWTSDVDPRAPDVVAMVRAELALLPEEEARAAVYYHMDGMSHVEISEVLGCSRRHVGNLLERVEKRVTRAEAS